ncbi:unnamed protein product [Laminaria digitata]
MAVIWIRFELSGVHIVMYLYMWLALMTLATPFWPFRLQQRAWLDAISSLVSSVSLHFRLAAFPFKLMSFTVVFSKLWWRVGLDNVLKVCSQQAYFLSKGGCLEHTSIVLEAENLSNLANASLCCPWLSVSFSNDPVFEGVWSVAGPATGGRGQGVVFVTQEEGTNEVFDSRSGTLYSKRFVPGIIICRSGYLFSCKPRTGYVNLPKATLSRKLVVWGTTTKSYWDYLAVLGVANTLVLLVQVLRGGQRSDVTVVFTINLGTELLAVILCVRENMGGHESLTLGSALDPVSALRFLSSSGLTVFFVLSLEVASALGGLMYLGMQHEWLLVALGGGITVIGLAASVALLPTRARWICAALVLYLAEFVVEAKLASRSPDSFLMVVLVSSIFETMELTFLISRIGYAARMLERSKTQGDIDVALELDLIASGESCNWDLGFALGRGMVSSKMVPAGKKWPKQLSVTQGTGEDAKIGGKTVSGQLRPDLELYGGNVELHCKRRDLLDGWGCIALKNGESFGLEPTCAFEDFSVIEDDIVFEPTDSQRFFGLKSYGGEVFPVFGGMQLQPAPHTVSTLATSSAGGDAKAEDSLTSV